MRKGDDGGEKREKKTGKKEKKIKMFLVATNVVASRPRPTDWNADRSCHNFACLVWSLEILARAVGVAVGRRSGGRMATTLVATKNVFIFLFIFFFHHHFFSPLFSVATFSHRRSARIKKLI